MNPYHLNDLPNERQTDTPQSDTDIQTDVPRLPDDVEAVQTVPMAGGMRGAIRRGIATTDYEYRP